MPGGATASGYSRRHEEAHSSRGGAVSSASARRRLRGFAAQRQFGEEDHVTFDDGFRLCLNQVPQSARDPCFQLDGPSGFRRAQDLHVSERSKFQTGQGSNDGIALRDHASQLGHCFHQENAGHERIAGKMAA